RPRSRGRPGALARRPRRGVQGLGGPGRRLPPPHAAVRRRRRIGPPRPHRGRRAPLDAPGRSRTPPPHARLVALGAATARRPRRVRGPLRRRRRLARPRRPRARTRAALTGLRRARLAPQETPRPVLRPGPAPRPPGRHPLPHGRGTDRAGGRPRRPTRLRGAMDTEYTDAVARYLRDREAAEAEARAARG